MKIFNRIIQILAGLMLLVFGANKFFNFIPMEHPEGIVGEVMMGFINAGYLMPTVAIVEIVVGLLFILNKYIPLALLLLAPISINIVGFHLALDPAGVGGAAFIMIVNIYFFYVNRDKFLFLLQDQK